FRPAGIAGGVSLPWARRGTLDSVAVSQHHDDSGAVKIRVDAMLSHLPPGIVYGRLVVSLLAPDAQLIAATWNGSFCFDDEGGGSVRGEGGKDQPPMRRISSPWISVERPELWWLRGLGPQPLYTLTVAWLPVADAVAAAAAGRIDEEPRAGTVAALSVGSGSGAAAALSAEADGVAGVTRLTRHIGLRHAELVREPVSDGGESFYFRINKQPTYAKGANWVPADSFQTRISEDDLRWLLHSAASAHMNMVRVWAGGPPQPDVFYDACDELGLLVWQELPYACALYPRDPPALAAAAAEAEAIVRRLQTHASVVLWGGSNEVEQALGWFNESSATAAGRERFRRDYEALFVDTLRPAVLGADPSGCPYLDSSPSNGGEEVAVGGNSDGGSSNGGRTSFVKRWGDPNDLRWGDVHMYAYDADCELEMPLYPPARFISEHGVQSMPSAAALAEAGADAEADASALLHFRQRHEGGDKEIRAQMARHFGEKRLPANLRRYLHLTQVQQGRCLRAAIAAWRRWWDGASSAAGATSGVLYWQLNDAWQGPSWSTLEYGGRWKASHYGVKRAFAPLLVAAAPGETAGEGILGRPPLVIRVTSDGPIPAVTGLVTASLFAWDKAGCEPLDAWRAAYAVDGPGTGEAMRLSADDIAAALDGGDSGGSGVFSGGMLHIEANGNDGAQSVAVFEVSNGTWSGGLAKATLQDPGIRVITAAAATPDGTAMELVLRASAPAVHVWLDVEPRIRGTFSDNDFAM
ncbi:unnamed protein product, partial [Phaeothamnion confervicola]